MGPISPTHYSGGISSDGPRPVSSRSLLHRNSFARGRSSTSAAASKTAADARPVASQVGVRMLTGWSGWRGILRGDGVELPRALCCCACRPGDIVFGHPTQVVLLRLLFSSIFSSNVLLLLLVCTLNELNSWASGIAINNALSCSLLWQISMSLPIF
uniref:Uncharacterized protein n=1 Tax=Arundo donax TaxID=35708 RepID=A0A0A9ACH4_ARUDO